MNRETTFLLSLLSSAPLLFAGCGDETAPPTDAPDTSADASLDATEGDASGDVARDTSEPDASDEDTRADSGEPDGAADAPPQEDVLSDLGLNERPIADIKCRVEGSTDEPSTTLSAPPLSTVICSAEDSVSAQGGLISYQWNVVGRPPASTSGPMPSDGVTTALFLDLSGNFLLELVATDDRGIPSDPVQASITAAPGSDILIELTWHAPDGDGDPNRSPDLDIHLLHPNGCWQDPRWDCNPSNHQPDWGEAGNEDDPVIDVDGMGGTEALQFDNPEEDTTYTLGVLYYDDKDQGDAIATVRVFMSGVLVFEAADKRLSNTEPGAGQWWVVGAIDWPSNEVRAIDTVSEGVPECVDLVP